MLEKHRYFTNQILYKYLLHESLKHSFPKLVHTWLGFSVYVFVIPLPPSNGITLVYQWQE
jgi:hypothetical protein